MTVKQHECFTELKVADLPHLHIFLCLHCLALQMGSFLCETLWRLLKLILKVTCFLGPFGVPKVTIRIVFTLYCFICFVNGALLHCVQHFCKLCCFRMCSMSKFDLI